MVLEALLCEKELEKLKKKYDKFPIDLGIHEKLKDTFMNKKRLLELAGIKLNESPASDKILFNSLTQLLLMEKIEATDREYFEFGQTLFGKLKTHFPDNILKQAKQATVKEYREMVRDSEEDVLEEGAKSKLTPDQEDEIQGFLEMTGDLIARGSGYRDYVEYALPLLKDIKLSGIPINTLSKVIRTSIEQEEGWTMEEINWINKMSKTVYGRPLIKSIKL